VLLNIFFNELGSARLVKVKDDSEAA